MTACLSSHLYYETIQHEISQTLSVTKIVLNSKCLAKLQYKGSDFFLQSHVVSAFEQSLSNMTQRLQQLSATNEKKVRYPAG